MRQTSKRAAVNTAVASVCILAYIAAVAFAAVRVFINSGEYRNLAAKEFYDLADRASSAAFMGFMSQPYQDSIREALEDSVTLRGIIISGPRGEYAFERVRGTAVEYQGDSPRFKRSFGLSRTPYETPLWVEGQDNLVIRGAYETVNYPFLVTTLQYALIMIGAALALALLTLLAGAIIGGGGKGDRKEAAADEAEEGPYSPRSNIRREELVRERLAGELRRAAAGGDLALIAAELNNRGISDEVLYRRFAGEAARFFGDRDCVFERGGQGISVIIPGVDLDGALAKAGEFHRLILAAYPALFPDESGLCIGLSSRSGRAVDADRLLFEAGTALQKALQDPASPIIAFRIDPEKYRAFMAQKNRRP
jgi:hypothetical protein